MCSLSLFDFVLHGQKCCSLLLKVEQLGVSCLRFEAYFAATSDALPAVWYGLSVTLHWKIAQIYCGAGWSAVFDRWREAGSTKDCCKLRRGYGLDWDAAEQLVGMSLADCRVGACRGGICDLKGSGTTREVIGVEPFFITFYYFPLMKHEWKGLLTGVLVVTRGSVCQYPVSVT